MLKPFLLFSCFFQDNNVYKSYYTKADMMKKKSLALIVLILSNFILPIVSAAWSFGGSGNFFETGMRDVIEGIKGFLGPFFEAIIGVSQFDQYFFVRVLILIIVFLISYLTLGKSAIFKEKPLVISVLSAIVGILGARYLGELDVIYTILLPYGALMISLTTILPFLIFFYFLHTAIESAVARRAFAVFFAIIFIGLWITRREIVPEFDWIYNLAIIGTILAVIFDSKIHGWLGLIEWQEARRSSVISSIVHLKAKREHLISLNSTDPDIINEIKRLEKQITELSKRR
jgi:hypothetical protein